MGLRRSHAVAAMATVASLAMVHALLATVTGAPVDDGRGLFPSHPVAGWAGALIALSAAFGLGLVAVRRFRAIVRRVAAPDASVHGPAFAHLLPYASRVAAAWRHLFVAVVVLFLVLEGVESISAGASLGGLVASLTTSLWVIVPSIALVTLLAAATMTLTDWCHCALLRRFARRAPRLHGVGRTPSSAVQRDDVLLMPSLFVAGSRGRSPPMGLSVTA